jgi:hypothetical protein
MLIRLMFSFSENQESIWGDIFNGLANGETGFRFQNRMSIFGEAVDEKLDEIMDEWSPLFFAVDRWECVDRKITAYFSTSAEGEFFAEDIEELFQLCCVKDLVVKTYSDEE